MTKEMKRYITIQKIQGQTTAEWRNERKKNAIALRHAVLCMQVLSLMLACSLAVASLIK